MNENQLFRSKARILNDDLGGSSYSPAADALLAQLQAIETDPVPPAQDRVRAPRRATRLLLGAVATALLAIAMTIGPSLLGTPDEVYAGEAVTIDRDGNDYVFYFTKGDPDPDSLRRAFRSVGLNISVTLVPVSPRDPFPYFSLISNGNDQTSYRSAECAERVEGCLGSMRVSADLTVPAEFRLGRPARPGEPYVASVDATLPGEILAGVQIDGRTAAEVVRIARERGLRVTYTIDWPLKEGVGFSTEGFEGEIPASRINSAWTVASVETYNDGAIIMHVIPGPGATPPPEFCRDHHGDSYPPIAC